jgi:enoyl-CoA hydratase/carnithine racemase
VIRVESLDDELVLVSLERPEKRNALTRPLIQRITLELRRLVDDPSVRGIVLAGTGPSFCAGVDLHEFSEGTPERGGRLIDALAQLCATVRTHPLPIACAIQGHCLGAALELAACCDVRVCAPDAQLGMPEVFLGIPSVIDAVMLGHVVGLGRSRELLLTGDSISGQTALEWGLATRLAPAGQLIEASCELLRRITRHDARVIAAQKRLHQEWLDLDYQDALEHSKRPLLEAFHEGRPQRLAAERINPERGLPP